MSSLPTCTFLLKSQQINSKPRRLPSGNSTPHQRITALTPTPRAITTKQKPKPTSTMLSLVLTADLQG